jgi:hypothetical protein
MTSSHAGRPRSPEVRAAIAEGQRRRWDERKAKQADLVDLRDRIDSLLAPGDDLAVWLKRLLSGSES